MPQILLKLLNGRQHPTMAEIFGHGTRLLDIPEQQAKLRVYIAGSVTADLIARAVAVGCVMEELPAAISLAPFGAWRQEVIDTTSGLFQFAPQVVLLAIDWRDALTALRLDASAEDVAASIEAKVAVFRAA